MTRRQWALVVVLVLINYIIFASLATVVLTRRARLSTPTRTPMPTFTVLVRATPIPPPTATPTKTPTATPTQYLVPTFTPVVPPTPTPEPVTPTPASPSVTVRVGLRVRAGPGVNYPQIGALTPGSTVQVIGRNADSSWWQIAYAGAVDGKGWISANPEYSTAQNTGAVPYVEAPPPPPPPTPTAPPPPPAPPTPQWQFEPTGFEGQWNAGLAQIRGKVVDTAGQPVQGVFMQAKCGDTVLASNPSGINLYAPSEPYEPGAFDIILSSPLDPRSMCRWEVRIVQASTYEEAKNPAAPSLSDTAYCDLEWGIASICFTRWRKNW
ncbi:MAG: SH3 domain-containing protein [Anaerolineae bacterium]|nr:SH3 domain-containing protein [Anaerolineae bacterium]MDW8072089.1 SH3 domain-containing protein [Anaerolineae bacterium]